MKVVMVHILWPGGMQKVEMDVDDAATAAEIEAAVQRVFFNLCSYGWHAQGE